VTDAPVAVYAVARRLGGQLPGMRCIESVTGPGATWSALSGGLAGLPSPACCVVDPVIACLCPTFQGGEPVQAVRSQAVRPAAADTDPCSGPGRGARRRAAEGPARYPRVTRVARLNHADRGSCEMRDEIAWDEL